MQNALSKFFKIYSDIPLPAKAAIWFTICTFFIKGLSFITGPLFTRLIPAEEYGKLSVFLSYEQLILILATWEIQLGAYQKGIFKFKENIELFTMSVYALINTITIILFIFIYIFRDYLIQYTNIPPSLLILMFFYLIVKPSYDCWLAQKRKTYEYKKVVTTTILFSLINIIIPIIAITKINPTANIKLGSSLLASIIFSSIFFLPYSKYWHLKRNWTKVKDYWKFCITFEGPLVLHSLSFLVLGQADRVMIGKMVGNSEAAFYSVAYTIASIISLLQNSINQSLSPWRYQMLENRNYKSIKEVTNQLLYFLGFLTIAFIIAVPDIMAILFPQNYLEAIWCLPPIATSIFFIFLYSIFVNIEEYFEKTQYVVYVSITCGIINIILNYYCIKIFGYISSAYTTLASYILFAIGHYLFMKKTLKEMSITEEIIDCSKTLSISILITVCSIIITWLYNYPKIRYTILVFIILGLIFKRKSLLQIFQKIKNKGN